MKAFNQVLEQQNLTTRPLGALQHRGLNLDGVINFCLRGGLTPELVAVDDVIQVVKHQLSDRQYLRENLE